MKKWLRYVLILILIPAFSFGGFGGEDVGKLSPAQVVLICSSGGSVQLVTDTEDTGIGADPEKAIMNMQETSAGAVFLDTADYLLIEYGTEGWLPQLRQYLRPSCHVCYVSGDVDPGQAGQFLQLHKPELTLADYEAGERQLSILISEGGKLKLERP